MDADQELDAWHCWRRACAFELLSEAECRGLKQVVGERFNSQVRKLRDTGAHLPMQDDSVAAHLFETWCALHPRRDGKRYKDWLLSRGRRDLDTIQSGVMLLVRNVVREWVMDCHARTAELSLDQPLKEAGGVTLRELVPEKSAAPQPNHTDWQQQRAAAWVENADPVVQAVFRVRSEGRVFSHPQVKADTGYGKTVLYKTHRQLLEQMAKEVQQEFPGLDAEQGSAMVLETMDLAGELILSKLSAENQA